MRLRLERKSFFPIKFYPGYQEKNFCLLINVSLTPDKLNSSDFFEILVPGGIKQNQINLILSYTGHKFQFSFYLILYVKLLGGSESIRNL